MRCCYGRSGNCTRKLRGGPAESRWHRSRSCRIRRLPTAGVLSPKRRAREAMSSSISVSPFDCSSAIDELDELEQLHREQPALRLVGILTGGTSGEAGTPLRSSALHSPFGPIGMPGFSTLLRPPRTPWKILVNSSTFRILYEDGPSIAPEEKKAFHHRIQFLLRGISPGLNRRTTRNHGEGRLHNRAWRDSRQSETGTGIAS